MDLERTGLLEGPLVQLSAGVEGDAALGCGFEFRVAKCDLRRTGVNVGANELPCRSVKLEILCCQLPGEARRWSRGLRR